MKRIQLLHFLALPVAAMLVAACEILTVSHDEEIRNVPLPPETQEGKNTFGCYVDGVPFVPDNTLISMVHPLTATYGYFAPAYFSIQGIDVCYEPTLGVDQGGHIYMRKKEVLSCREYLLAPDIPDCHNDSCSTGSFYGYSKGTDLIEDGKITITKLDTIQKIISGRFYFTTMEGKKITDGRFDVKYFNNLY